ncbi:unnamed protein product [Rotaria sordida]|uniref:Uncharacterized protein n=1 Tax=Rotaria sordida TaxID=392033 RepID=A0A814D4H2_9BILA|nr:unnamed protein product [Rotaria sordida]CAF3683367.1 unnamed protein product [Rotaria sordida]
MADTMSVLEMFSPNQNISLKETKNYRQNGSINSNEITTPSIKSLSLLENIDKKSNDCLSLEHNQSDSLSAYEKLTTWKKSIETYLNHIYFNKLTEIDNLLAHGQNQIDIIFKKIPSFEQLVTITSQQQTIDHTYDDIELDYTNSQLFDLTSNNTLLCTSNYYALIYDDITSNLILYNNQSKLNSYLWNIDEYGQPCDLTYSYYLNIYCIITNRGLFTWSYENPFIPLYIDSIKPIHGNRLWTIASTDTRSDVFILFKSGNYIERWNSKIDTKSWQHIKRWSNHELFERNDQRIRTIRMTSNYVAWTVESTKIFEWRVDLLDYNLQIIRQGIKIDYLNKHSSCLLSNFGLEQYLIVDSNGHLLFLLDSNGYIHLKNDDITNKRINNAVFMNNNNQQWLIVRLEQPNQLHFIPLLNKTDNKK